MTDYVEGKWCNTEYEDLVASTLRAELGSEPRLIAIPTFPDTIVYEANADTKAWMFKAMDPSGRDRDGIALEAWAYDQAREVGVPVPRIQVVDTSCSRFPASYFVVEKAKGDSLERLSLAPEALQAALLDLGSHMRTLHEIELHGFGWLDGDSLPLHRRSQGLCGAVA